ncbi:MAG TPA: hypothetical protein VN999_19725, partial [Thermoanaerobaculia bacterium]|nr:hypothetical protein [Thermoanaerobaculia bacterium]
LLTRVSHFFFGPPADARSAAADIGDIGGSGDIGEGEISPARARELAAARRRRIAVGTGLGAVLLLGGLAAWRRRARRLANGSDQGEK